MAASSPWAPPRVPCRASRSSASRCLCCPCTGVLLSSLEWTHSQPPPTGPPPVHTAGLAIFACVPTTLGVGQALVLTSRGNTAVALLLLVGTNLLGVASMPPMIKCESLGRRRAGSVPLGRVGTLVGSHGCRWQPEGLPAVATDGAMAAVSSLPECHLH